MREYIRFDMSRAIERAKGIGALIALPSFISSSYLFYALKRANRDLSALKFQEKINGHNLLSGDFWTNGHFGTEEILHLATAGLGLGFVILFTSYLLSKPQ